MFEATADGEMPIDDRVPLLFYCHDALRGGSARRAALVASLSSHFRVVLVGGPEALERVDVPPAVEVVRLPSLGSADASPARARVLLGAYLEIDPAVLLIEQFPFGCAQLADDIVSVLEGATANPRTRLVACSVVDFLVDQSFLARRRAVQAQRLANWYFDVVFVHADPRVGRFGEAFEPQTLRVPVRYTGFVAPVTIRRAGGDGLAAVRNRGDVRQRTARPVAVPGDTEAAAALFQARIDPGPRRRCESSSGWPIRPRCTRRHLPASTRRRPSRASPPETGRSSRSGTCDPRDFRPRPPDVPRARESASATPAE